MLKYAILGFSVVQVVPRVHSVRLVPIQIQKLDKQAALSVTKVIKRGWLVSDLGHSQMIGVSLTCIKRDACFYCKIIARGFVRRICFIFLLITLSIQITQYTKQYDRSKTPCFLSRRFLQS